MGVRGLQSFLKNNPDLLVKIDLSDTDLVIDANNLLCMLFTLLCKQPGFHSNDIYGGDMVAYGKLVRLFFQNLDQCNIRPLLVFDGSVIGKQSTQDKILLKTSTVYKRGLDRFNYVKTMQESQLENSDNNFLSNITIMPQTINHVFKSIAMDQGIKRIQAPYEADSHIARLANELGCPILTNDSDFLVFDIPNGYIMIDMFDFMHIKQRKNISQPVQNSYSSPEPEHNKRHKNRSNCFIQCYILTQKLFVRYFPGIMPTTMPLLSVLLGNDYIETYTFDKLCDRVATDPYRGSLRADTYAHRKIVRILQWLCGKNRAEAIDLLVQPIGISDRSNIRKVINVLLRNYKIEDSDNFISELDEVYQPNKSEPDSYTAETPAKYLKRLMEQGTLSSLILDISFHNPNYNYAIIDDFVMPSSSVVKYRPISVCITLLRPRVIPPNATTMVKGQNNQQDAHIIWDRINGVYDKKLIFPCLKLEKFGSLEHLNIYSMMTMDDSLKRLLLLETFHSSLDELALMVDSFRHIISPELSKQAGLVMMLVRYVSIETRLRAKPQFVDALCLMMIYHGILCKDAKLKESVNEQSIENLKLQIDFYAIKMNTSQTPMEPIYRRIMHFISQLQASIISYECLNTLLDNALSTLKLEEYFNCVLVFNLTKCLRLEKITIESLLKGADYSCLLDCCNLIKTLVDVDQ